MMVLWIIGAAVAGFLGFVSSLTFHDKAETQLSNLNQAERARYAASRQRAISHGLLAAIVVLLSFIAIQAGGS